MTASRPLPPLVLASLLLAGCATTTATVGTDPEAYDPTAVCVVWLPVTWSSSDTDQTIREAKANNRARAAWCGPSSTSE